MEIDMCTYFGFPVARLPYDGENAMWCICRGRPGYGSDRHLWCKKSKCVCHDGIGELH